MAPERGRGGRAGSASVEPGVRPGLAALCLAATLVAGVARAEAPLEAPEPMAEADGVLEDFDLVLPPGEDRPRLVELTGLVKGRPLTTADLRRALEVLYLLGRFESVRAFARRQTGGGVELRIEVTAQPYVKDLAIEGDGASSAVERAIGLRAGDAFTRASLAARRQAVQAVLVRAGYEAPAIGFVELEREPDGGVVLVARVDVGPRTRVADVVIDGGARLGARRVFEALGLEVGDPLDLEVLDAGLERVRALHRRSHYWDVEVDAPRLERLEPDAEGPRVRVVVAIRSGPRYSVGFVGGAAVPRGELSAAAGALVEGGVSLATLAEAEAAILHRFARRGYVDARVAVRVTPTSTAAAERRVEFGVREGRRARVRAVRFPGNTVLETRRLEDVVERNVRLVLDEELARPRPDPATLDAVLSGPPATPAARRVTKAPGPIDVDPREVYLERAYRVAGDEIADLYRAEGYPEVEVSPPRVTRTASGAELVVTVPVRPGPRWSVRAVAFRGNERVGGVDLLDRVGEKPGEPLAFAELERSRRAIVTTYRERGHLFARVDEALVGPTGVRVEAGGAVGLGALCARGDAEDELAAPLRECPVTVEWTIHEGPEVRTRNVLVRGLERTSRSLVEAELTVQSGAVLTAPQLEESERNLLRLGVFRRVSVRPLDEDEEAAEKDVVAEVREAKALSFEIGAGVSTEEGLRATATFTHANLFGDALRLQANLRINYPTLLFYNEAVRDAISRFFAVRPIEYTAAIGLAWPRMTFLPRGFTGGVDVAIVRNSDPSYGEDRRTLTATLDYRGLAPRIAGRARPLVLQLRGSLDSAGLVCNPALPERGAELCGASSLDPNRRREGETFYFGLRPSVSFDLRDDPFSPRAGLYAELLPELLGGVGAASPSHLNVRARLNGYAPLPFGSAFAVSLVYWQLFPIESDVAVPVNRRFFAGGRSTIRGYPEQTLFPRDADPASAGTALSPGGLLMLALKSELRVPVTGPLDVTVFYDVGDLFEDPSKLVIDGRTRMGVGGGLRYSTPIGPLLLDIAFPLNRRDGELAWVPHFAAVGTF